MKLVYYLLKLGAREKDFRVLYVCLVFKIHALSTRPWYLLGTLTKQVKKYLVASVHQEKVQERVRSKERVGKLLSAVLETSDPSVKYPSRRTTGCNGHWSGPTPNLEFSGGPFFQPELNC
ncbi:hypothetical protein CDAR_565531 [Caerostris darwini]|uniref:Uncharacterized protein n=1 Tax=Caerostris darwini TaxID=1538125 RepID=A0AAV4TU10_9ARAC|nr:hypothetical protein CDAR_565531 [Caerostris darwini]